MKFAKVICLSAAIVAVPALADAQGVLKVDEVAARTRRSGIDRIVEQWVRETRLDFLVWTKTPNDKSPEAARLLKRLRDGADRAARQLDQIACDGDDKLPDYAVQAYARGAGATADFVTSKVFTVACSGKVLKVTVKQPSSP